MTTAPTGPLSGPMSTSTAQALDSTLRAGAMLMQSGASSESAMVAMREMLAGLGQSSASLTISGDAIVASTMEQGVPITMMWPIPSLGANLERVSLLHKLAEQVRRHAVPANETPAEIASISAGPAPYGVLPLALAVGTAGLAFNQLLGGTLASAALVFAANAIAYLARSVLLKQGLPAAITTAVTAVVATFIATFGVRLGMAPSAASTFVPAVTLLIPGFALINGLLDLFSIRYVMAGAQRVIIASLTFLMVGIGIALGVSLAGG